MSADPRRYRIELDLSVAGDEVCGRAATPGRDSRDFTGWMGLIASIDALTALGNPAATVPQPAPGTVPADLDRKDS